MRRDLDQLSFADGLLKHRSGKTAWLDEVEKLILWKPLEEIMRPLHSSDEGAPSYPNLVMLRMLLLQNWCNLADEGIEEAVDDGGNHRGL